MSVVRHPLFVVRCLVAFCLIVGGYVSLSRSAAVALSKSDPFLALQVFGGDARIRARAAQRTIEIASSDKDRLQAVALAQRAFLRDATSVAAADALGLSAGLVGNDLLQAKWFVYSESLSRRDLPTQLYFIETAVSQGNIKKALRHYDVALRTAGDSGTAILFPVLRQAIADRAIRLELARTLSGKPIWAAGFLSDLVTNGPHFAEAAQLLMDARSLGVVISPDVEVGLLNNLAGRGDIRNAWRYYIGSHAGAERSLLRNGNFQAEQFASTPFDWQLTSGSGISVNLGASDDNRSLEYQLSPTVGATIARQVTLLAPGRYRIESIVAETSQTLGAGPYWELACAGGTSIVSLEMGGPNSNGRKFYVDAVVPQGCDTQSLMLIVRASDDISGATGRIGSISISRIE